MDCNRIKRVTTYQGNSYTIFALPMPSLAPDEIKYRIRNLFVNSSGDIGLVGEPIIKLKYLSSKLCTAIINKKEICKFIHFSDFPLVEG